MKICQDCLDVTIKNCYFCSIGQQILEECKCSKSHTTLKKKKLADIEKSSYKEPMYMK